MPDGEVVEAAPATVEQEDMVPHGGVELVAATWGEAHIQALAFGHGFPFSGHVVHHIQGDGPGTIVGIEVDGDPPTIPVLFGGVFEIGRECVVGQHHAIDEVGVLIACGQHVDAAIGRGAVGVGTDGFVVAQDGRQAIAVAIAVIADAKEVAPVLAPHVAFNLQDASGGEVETVFGDAVRSDVAITGSGAIREHPDGLVGSGLLWCPVEEVCQIARVERSATVASTVRTGNPAILAVQRSLFGAVVEVESDFSLCIGSECQNHHSKE